MFSQWLAIRDAEYTNLTNWVSGYTSKS